MNSLTQAQMDVLIRNLLRMLEGLSFDLPKDVEHSWGKLSSLLQEPNRYPIDLLREATLTLHRLGCFKSFEDRGDTFVCGRAEQAGRGQAGADGTGFVPSKDFGIYLFCRGVWLDHEASAIVTAFSFASKPLMSS